MHGIKLLPSGNKYFYKPLRRTLSQFPLSKDGSNYGSGKSAAFNSRNPLRSMEVPISRHIEGFFGLLAARVYQKNWNAKDLATLKFV